MIGRFVFRRFRASVLAIGLAAVGGCTDWADVYEVGATDPVFATRSETGLYLEGLAPPKRPVDVAVYTFNDQTGQQKPADNFSRFSKAVTQGGSAVLVDILSEVGGGKWFTVVERTGLENLLNERNIIDQTNRAYRDVKTSVLPPLRFAGIILEGGIIDYDTNVTTGGIGARLLGVGGSTQVRTDRLTVSLRAVSVNSGEVLTSVMTEKTIYSALVSGDVYRFVASDAIFELDTGTSRNEPVGFAVRQAMELAVYRLIMEGAEDGVWSFGDPATQRALLAEYRARLAAAPKVTSGQVTTDGS